MRLYIVGKCINDPSDFLELLKAGFRVLNYTLKIRKMFRLSKTAIFGGLAAVGIISSPIVYDMYVKRNAEEKLIQ